MKQIMSWMGKGTKIYYVTGNHDEMLRKFVGFKMGSLRIVNKVVLPLSNGKTAWFFHGDVFDVTMQHSKWLAQLGAKGYDTLILINRFANFILEKMFKKGKLSLSKKIKNSVKSAVKFVNNFEQTAADIGISNKYDYVVCGHIYQPEIREIKNFLWCPFFYGKRGICIVWPATIPRGGIKSGVLLGFWYGNQLNDVDHYLTHGTNKQIFYKIYQSPEEIDEAAIRKLLEEAVRIDRGKSPIVFKKKLVR